ncbi:LacI family DNA-binding transcriptional regulator [Shinella sp. S4-D37]|uniref:LacI family DNA-binding transcriptional regulator n=1 Tax=Shinella sp. S4-D37 TaxID=3161999 RepID=UPI00346563A1
MKPTVLDVARQAKVSSGTVDRVINRRGGVAPATEARVLSAVKSLNYRSSPPAIIKKEKRIDVILPHSATPTCKRLSDLYLQITNAHRGRVKIYRRLHDNYNPDKVADEISRISSDGLVLFCPYEKSVVEATRSAVKSGQRVVTIISDLPDSGRERFVGINNFAVGQTAAHTVLPAEGTVNRLIFIREEFNYQAQLDRINGFEAVLRESAHRNSPIETHAYKHKQTCLELEARLAKRTDERHVYYLTCPITHEISMAIRRSAGTRNVIVTHELNELTVKLLESNYISCLIDQGIEEQTSKSIRILMDEPGTDGRDNGFISFTLHTKFNTLKPTVFDWLGAVEQA